MQPNKNTLLAAILSAIILIGWTWFYEKPKMEKIQQQQKIATEKKSSPTTSELNQTNNLDGPASNKAAKQQIEAAGSLASRATALEKSATQRIKISSPEVEGSINLKGAKFDDLTLVNYRKTIDPDSAQVVLLAPTESVERYFIDFGWASANKEIILPDANTLWKADGKDLTPGKKINLSWKNPQNILFTSTIAMDEHFMFSIFQSVKNLSGTPISLASYGRVNRILNNANKSNYILHEGPIGAFNDILQEITYKDLAEEKNEFFQAKKGWLGITDKYWLTAIIPDKNLEFQARFTYDSVNQNDIYNSEFIGKEVIVGNGEEIKFKHHLFAGAKRVTLLDQYSDEYDIALFDRAVDFGWYYFLTKPFFFILKTFSDILGNYGLAILAMTVLIKLIMYPLANKSYMAMNRIKHLQPKVEKIRQANKENRMQMNKDIMELYRKEKVNPASGCLPMLIQIPVFFSLYKVLFVTIDMRHAPFYGWIKDLSAPDPTSIFNLFGLLPFTPPMFLIIGVWPILMGATMLLQQKLGPQIADPTQAKVMKILPFILIFVFAAFPAGLLIYWTWSNILSIAQQWYINKKTEQKKIAA